MALAGRGQDVGSVAGAIPDRNEGVDLMNKAQRHADVYPKEWDCHLGRIRVRSVEVRDGNLWVFLDETDFPVDPGGYVFVNPPLKLKHGGALNPRAAFKRIVEDAATHYAVSR